MTAHVSTLTYVITLLLQLFYHYKLTERSGCL
jgi:hypothetical protein